MTLTARRTILVAAAATLAVATPVLVGLSSAPRLRAQALQPAVAGGTPAFEVASVKRNTDPDGPRLFSAQPGGRVNLINQTVRQLIYSSYQTQEYRIIGGPAWLSTDRFDIVAKAADNAPPPQMLLMVRTLLADRFKLTMHAEMRELPIYRLVMARSDRQPGPGLKASNCGPATVNPTDRGGRPPCGNRGGQGLLASGGGTMATLANQLGRLAVIGRPVVDQTGLSGAFDYELTFTPDQPGVAAPADAVSIFTALQEQFGVKLESARGPVDVLVIDQVERPTDDQGSPSGSIATPRSFDVASIKPNTSGDPRVSGGFQQGGRYSVTNCTLRALIAAAYVRPQLNPDFLISGGPKWIDADHFDVDARAAGELPLSTGADTASSPRRAMLQALLAERFKLKVHTETSERPIYALVAARPDGKTGPQLHPSTADCVADPSACALVVDRTGLVGPFAIDLRWTPAPGEWIAPPSPGASDPPADGPSLFTALQEQLGLRLESQRGPVDVLVVDSAEPPTAN